MICRWPKAFAVGQKKAKEENRLQYTLTVTPAKHSKHEHPKPLMLGFVEEQEAKDWHRAISQASKAHSDEPIMLPALPQPATATAAADSGAADAPQETVAEEDEFHEVSEGAQSVVRASSNRAYSNGASCNRSSVCACVHGCCVSAPVPPLAFCIGGYSYVGSRLPLPPRGALLPMVRGVEHCLFVPHPAAGGNEREAPPGKSTFPGVQRSARRRPSPASFQMTKVHSKDRSQGINIAVTDLVNK